MHAVYTLFKYILLFRTRQFTAAVESAAAQEPFLSLCASCARLSSKLHIALHLLSQTPFQPLWKRASVACLAALSPLGPFPCAHLHPSHDWANPGGPTTEACVPSLSPPPTPLQSMRQRTTVAGEAWRGFLTIYATGSTLYLHPLAPWSRPPPSHLPHAPRPCLASLPVCPLVSPTFFCDGCPAKVDTVNDLRDGLALCDIAQLIHVSNPLRSRRDVSPLRDESACHWLLRSTSKTRNTSTSHVSSRAVHALTLPRALSGFLAPRLLTFIHALGVHDNRQKQPVPDLHGAPRMQSFVLFLAQHEGTLRNSRLAPCFYPTTGKKDCSHQLSSSSTAAAAPPP